MRTLTNFALEGGPPTSLGSTAVVLNRVDQGKFYALDSTVGSTVSLPASIGDGGVYNFIVSAVPGGTTSHVIKVGNTNDVLSGVAFVAGTGSSAAFDGWVTDATSDTITLNADTSGGVTVGERVTAIDAMSGTWFVQAMLTNSGTATTPFSATV